MYLLNFIRVKPGALDQVEAIINEISISFTDRSKPLRLWRTDIGQLNQLIVLWSLGDGENEINHANSNLVSTHPELAGLIVENVYQVLRPAPFSPPIFTGASSPVNEIRTYRYKNEFVGEVIAKWAKKIQARTTLSDLLFCGYTESGPISEWVHIWPYNDLLERSEVRHSAIAQGLWPPGAFSGLIDQTSMIVVPAKNSGIGSELLSK